MVASSKGKFVFTPTFLLVNVSAGDKENDLHVVYRRIPVFCAEGAENGVPGNQERYVRRLKLIVF